MISSELHFLLSPDTQMKEQLQGVKWLSLSTWTIWKTLHDAHLPRGAERRVDRGGKWKIHLDMDPLRKKPSQLEVIACVETDWSM